MKNYETVVIFKSDVTKEYISTVTKKIEKVIKSKPGKLDKKDDWGIKKFAYPIKKYAEGHYIIWHFENEPTIVKEIDKALRFDENILRYSTLVAVTAVKGTTGNNKKTLRTKGGKRVHVDYKEPVTLNKFLTERGKIVPRRVSGVDARTQQRISQAVKRARQFALLSFTDGIYVPHDKSDRKPTDRKYTDRKPMDRKQSASS